MIYISRYIRKNGSIVIPTSYKDPEPLSLSLSLSIKKVRIKENKKCQSFIAIRWLVDRVTRTKYLANTYKYFGLHERREDVYDNVDGCRVVKFQSGSFSLSLCIYMYMYMERKTRVLGGTRIVGTHNRERRCEQRRVGRSAV